VSSRMIRHGAANAGIERRVAAVPFT
jgi:hypothetical protein